MPKLELTETGVLAIGGVVVVGLAALWLYSLYKNRAFDPTSDQNLAASGVNNIGAHLSGDQYWTLGGWLREVTSRDDEKIRDMLRGSETSAGRLTTYDVSSDTAPYVAP